MTLTLMMIMIMMMLHMNPGKCGSNPMRAPLMMLHMMMLHMNPGKCVVQAENFRIPVWVLCDDDFIVFKVKL
jgi:hypothetical protein